MDTYDMFEFNYYDKETGQGYVVYARTEETANKIIDIVNDQNVYYFVKPRFKKFKAPFLTEIPPYELETEQLEIVTKQRDHRLKYQKEHPEKNK